ncbi:hypothetical protein GQ600_6292 [Phytophthora cactorum]|nr:hypothetical protein GQ600_6292 [Phytophthora cactorum]
MRKRSAGSLLAYCAQVVTTSLAGVRSSLHRRQKLHLHGNSTAYHQCMKSTKKLDSAVDQAVAVNLWMWHYQTSRSGCFRRSTKL